MQGAGLQPPKQTSLSTFSASRILLSRRGADPKTSWWALGKPRHGGPRLPCRLSGDHALGGQAAQQWLRYLVQRAEQGCWENHYSVGWAEPKGNSAFQAKRATKTGPVRLVITAPRALTAYPWPAVQARPV